MFQAILSLDKLLSLPSVYLELDTSIWILFEFFIKKSSKFLIKITKKGAMIWLKLNFETI